jgi:hypothetical protein
MTVKPTSDDVWTVVIVGLLLAGGSAFFLRGLRPGAARDTPAPTGAG